jgi:death-on-curing protein
VQYLEKKDVMLMHGILINRFGGMPGIRDESALEAALYRPRSGYYSDLLSQAAALFESLAINHPFVDGIKRVAFAAMDTFLRSNGMRIDASPKEIYEKIIFMFEQQELKHKFIESWLRTICKKSTQSI